MGLPSSVVGDQAMGIPDAIHSKNICASLQYSIFLDTKHKGARSKFFRENKTFFVRGGTNDEAVPTT